MAGFLRSLACQSTRRLLSTSLILVLASLLITLRFVSKTTGGTLFLFTTLAPVLVILSTGLLIWVLVREYRQAHRLFSIERYEPDQWVFRQGDEGDCMYFIRSGEVEVVLEEDGTVLNRLGKGDYFGEMALLSESPRSATVRAITSVEVAILGRKNFFDMMRLVPTTEDSILNTARKRAMRMRG